TRGVKTIPKGAAFRPTLMQLMLYQLLLSELATNKVDADTIFNRYSLDSNTNFSDSFIAQIGSLNEIYYDAPSDLPESPEPQASDQDPIQVLLTHNSLGSLWTFMIQEFQRTLPNGIDSIGNVLKAEYRDQTDGTILGIKTFLYDHNVISEYVDNELRWWRGEREAQGVIVEEAYKCRISLYDGRFEDTKFPAEDETAFPEIVAMISIHAGNTLDTIPHAPVQIEYKGR
ncbi:MAG: hypothetical protein Q9187_000447, partial [Circinaria calcarea]